ncbi:hypothetical protein MMC25_006251 [Agyrium rufum]|nr:hypothetical protein [Agyrium rufum]
MTSQPTHTSRYEVGPEKNFDALTFKENVPIPDLKERDVLVKWQYASLNFRDLIIAKKSYPFGISPNVVPSSDGAGTVLAVGSGVTRFKTGDNVLSIFTQGHYTGPLTPELSGNGTGGGRDGTLTKYSAFDEEDLVSSPKNLSLQEASTLTCAGVTAWNALYGLASKALKPGDWVLTQGTGGVSILGLQFAKAAGCRVIATTSSAEKAEVLKKLGADHVLNYKEDPNWGTTAKDLTPNKHGVDHVIEVGGPTTIKQSLEAIKIDGVITIIGFIGGMKGDEQPPGFLDCLMKGCIARGVLVGPRSLFEEMNRAIEANDIKPVVDEKVFKFSELKEAYQYMWDQKHFGKLTIKIQD